MDKNDKKIERDEETEEKGKDKKEIVRLKQRIEDLENQIKRVLADYQNLEKRVAEQRRDLIINANKHLLLRLLPVLDTLMFALLHTKDKGLELSIQQFMDAFSAEGVRRIETKDKMFDPKLMECVETAEGEDGKVTSEVSAGYMLNEEVLRPAKVKVGKKNIEKEEIN